MVTQRRSARAEAPWTGVVPGVFVLSYVPPVMGPLNACHAVDEEVGHRHGTSGGSNGSDSTLT